jgi:hypothetical protein
MPVTLIYRPRTSAFHSQFSSSVTHAWTHGMCERTHGGACLSPAQPTSKPVVIPAKPKCALKFVWLGWPYLRIKAQGPWHKGACFDFLPSFGGAFYTKSARRPRHNRLEVIHKNVSDWFYGWVALIQILKAVTMIMVTAITFFWSNMANPAI